VTRKRVRRSIVAAAVIVALLFAANIGRRVVEGEAERNTDAAFYTLPSSIPAGAPGTIIRSEQIASAPLGSTAWRVIYHSRDQAGNDIPVSGIIVAPDGPAPKGGRTIVSWAHPTTGAAVNCAPSLGTDPFLLIEGMHELLAAGYVIAATDYPGMGVDGASSYLLGVPEANSVLDAARAARNISDTHASDRLMLWGHSQGGQAALFAAQRDASYSPDLHLEGVAVAAPAANLNALMTDDIVNLSGVTIASYAFPSFEAAYAGRYSKESIDSVLTPAGAAATPRMAALCLLSQNKQIHAIADPLVGRYVTSDPATTEPWQTMLRENSAGGAPITVPVFVGQGLADKLVIPSATEAYVRLLCSQGADVAFHTFPHINHGLVAYASIPELLPWMAQVDTGRRPASNC
jgi:alpha-beta hydrolase superfamily lysophospholipase